jgi:predicted ABC-type ATPase
VVRPILFVLAGVNGAGKSSIGGHLLERQNITWFNPDTFARELAAASGCDQATANSLAWAESLRRLDEAIALGHDHAFETTLGGHTIVARIAAACDAHDVMIWFCGLASPDQHVARVLARVAAGGHDIPEDRIRERYPRALQNLIALMPRLAQLQVYDNSADVPAGSPIPDPVLVLEMARGRLIRPSRGDVKSLSRTPQWAKPLMEAALTNPAARRV